MPSKLMSQGLMHIIMLLLTLKQNKLHSKNGCCNSFSHFERVLELKFKPAIIMMLENLVVPNRVYSGFQELEINNSRRPREWRC